MQEHEIEGQGSTEGGEAGLPSLTESLVVLGLLIIAAIGCCLMYGPLIGLMFSYAKQNL
ncbi:MAG: hypothetical protein ABFD69_11030 [Candidatus Sumerlaeia bacterium]